LSNKHIPARETDDTIKKQIINSFKKKQKEENSKKIQYVNEISKKWDMNDKIIELFAKNIEKDQLLKEKYAIKLISLLKSQLFALTLIFILKGIGKLSYSDTTFNIFITGGIAEIFVLVKVIVKYLFKDNLTDALKIILTNNNQLKNNRNKNKNNIKKSDKP
jgi:hypothetical protein